MHERSELDYLIYNAPQEYADAILNDAPEAFLEAITEYKCWTDTKGGITYVGKSNAIKYRYNN